jgi:hypothetical protein
MQGESAATSGCHSANAAVAHNEDQMAEATIVVLVNLSTATAADQGGCHTGQFPSYQTTGGQLKRVAGTQCFTQEGKQ